MIGRGGGPSSGNAGGRGRRRVPAASEMSGGDERGMAPSYSDDDFVIEGDEPRELRRPLEGADAPLENYRKLHVPRRRLARWCNLPNFDEAVTGFYVLVRTDRDGAAGRSARQLCRIEGVRRGGGVRPPPVGGRAERCNDGQAPPAGVRAQDVHGRDRAGVGREAHGRGRREPGRPA
ncbi:hypothetical protein THAOC_33262, partial [Thalassiosira oceanica]